MKPEVLREMALRLAEDLHHEARLERILDKIEYHYTIVWADGFADGFSQGRTALAPVDEVEEMFQREFSLPDATGTP